MSNLVYGKARDKFLNGDLDWTTGPIKAILVDVADYTVSGDVDQYLSDVPSAARVATSGSLTASSALGVANVANFSFSAVTGDPSEALVFYHDTGSAATSELICYIDTATGLPVTPNGGNININIDTGGNKLFKL
jgi:hypothetical protein